VLSVPARLPDPELVNFRRVSDREPTRRTRRWQAALLAFGVAGAAVVATAARLVELVRRDAERPGDAGAEILVVFGARVTPSGPTRELRARLDHAVQLWQDGRAPRVMCCGGMSGETDERVAMSDYLAEAGIGREAIEWGAGSTTRQSITSVVERGYPTMLAVTSPYHVHRVVAEARRQGLEPVGCPAPHSPEFADLSTRRVRIATEVLASAWYALPASWTGRVATGPTTLRHRIPRVAVGWLENRRGWRWN
jgi:uncharacterized SAM-binding protein YcdF (DUF218 family)